MPFERTQLSLGTTLSTHPHEADDPRAGDLDVSVRVNFGRQTALVPTLAALVGATFPTGVDSRAYGVVLKGYATKTILGMVDLHLNAGLHHVVNADHQEGHTVDRFEGRLQATLGLSRRGVPR